MKKHLFVFEPNCTEVLVREYLCDCEQYLDLNFEECCKEEHQHQSDLNDLDDDDNDCHLDEDIPGSQSLLYEFVETPSTVAVLSSSISDPLYLITVFEKGIAEQQQLNDLYGHVIFTGEYYLKGHYLRKERCKTLSKIQFSTIKEPVYITPDEILETFVEVDDNLQISKETFSSIPSRSR